MRLFTFMAADLGRDRLEQILMEGTTVESALATFRAAHPQLRWPPECMIAVNQEYVAMSHILQEADEIAVIPPVSGGISKQITRGSACE